MKITELLLIMEDIRRKYGDLEVSIPLEIDTKEIRTSFSAAAIVLIQGTKEICILDYPAYESYLECMKRNGLNPNYIPQDELEKKT